MYQRIIEIGNEIESLKVKTLLESNGVPIVLKPIQDSAFPALENKQNLYHLIIPEEYSSTYFRLIENDYPNKLIEINKEEKSSKTKFWLYLMIGYGVIMSLLFLKYFDINRKNSSDKNFTYRWSYDNTELNLVSKATKRVHTVYVDKNFDLNYEKIVAYIGGRKVSASIDKDENGIYEEVRFFDLQGNNAGISLDEDQDGLFETSTMILENREKLIFVDKNKNGLFELKK